MKLTTLRPLLLSLAALVFIGGCAVNPVTGKKELLLVGEDWELNTGKQNYLPLRQMQGGDYTADPGVEEYVRAVGAKLAAHSDRELPYEFNVINDSTPNAWALPGGKISINRGLLHELKDEAELSAVLAHEIVHSAAKHGARGQTRGVWLQGAVIAATVAGSRKGYGQAAQTASAIGGQLVNQKYGRNQELESDLYGMRYMAAAGYDPQGAVDLQETFVRLSAGRKSDFLSNMFASHPPSQERVNKNRATAKTLPAGGERGREQYERAMSRIKKTAPAYEKFAQAQKSANDKNWKQAVALAKEASRIEPREGHFHSFLGDISINANNYKAAKTYFDRAIDVNPEFFYYHVRRGEVNQKNGNTQAARTDYENSMKLLPVAQAQYGLGIIERDAGNVKKAKQYLGAASQTEGEVGKKATDALLALDLGDNPGNYISIKQGLSKNGTFAFQLINNTTRALTGIKLGVRMGRSNTTSNVDGVLGAGETRLVDTGRKMTPAQADAVSLQVLDATAQQ